MAEVTEPIKELPDQVRPGVDAWISGIRTELPNPAMGKSAVAEPPPETEETPAPEKPASLDAGAKAPETETKPEDKAPIDESKWPRNAKEWKAFKAEAKKREDDLAKQLSEWQAKHKELEGKVSTAPVKDEASIKEAEKWKKTSDEYSEQLRLLAVERHPKFKAHYDARVNAALEDAKGIVGEAHADGVVKLLSQSPSAERTAQLEEIVLTLSPLDQAQLGAVIRDLRTIEKERSTEVTRAKADFDKMMESEQSRTKAAQERFQKSVADAIQSAQDSKMGRPEYQLREGDTAWNENVTKRIDHARRLMTEKLNESDIFNAAMDAAAYPAVLEQTKALMAENSKLQEQVKSLTAATPSIKTERSSPPANGQPPGKAPQAGARPMELTRNWVDNMRAARNQSD